MSRRSTLLVVIVLLALAAVLRLWDLELRPPHHDEGVNGWFTEGIHRDGYYRYDPSNYHGPTYFYLLAASRELFGFGTWQLRLPGALVGIALCFIPLLVRRRIGGPAALVACALLVTSPTLVYFARYAIHETLLAALGLLAAACTLRWSDGGRVRWLLGATACLAGMIATKETTVLFLAPAGAWLLGESIVESVRARRVRVLGNELVWSWRVPVIALAVVAICACVHVLAFTAAFRAPGSIASQLHRSIESYLLWSKTGTDHGGHVKAAWYYLQLGLRYELVIYVLAIAGTLAGFRRRAIRGPALVGFAMLGLYSAIPYKMPWLPMSWLALLAIPAGYGAFVVVRAIRAHIREASEIAVIAALLVAPLAITWRSSFVRPASAREALAYVHTDADYDRWFPYVAMAAESLGNGGVTITVDQAVQWPLAWTLSPYPQTRWGEALGTEHIIIAAASRKAEVERRLGIRYLRARYRIRDSAEDVLIYLRHDTFAQRVPAFMVIEGGAR